MNLRVLRSLAPPSLGWLLATVGLMAGATVAKADLTIVAFGDSTTAPRTGVVVYADLLARELPENRGPVRVVNAGVPSNTTKDAAARFEQDVHLKKPNVVIIQFGINDAAIDVWKVPPATSSRVPQEQYVANLGFFVRTLRDEGVQVILMTPNSKRWTEKMKEMYGRPPYDAADPEGFNKYLRRYADLVRQLAKSEGVPLVDVYAAFEKHGSVAGQAVDDLLLDGVHPNSRGHRLIADLLLGEILREK